MKFITVCCLAILVLLVSEVNGQARYRGFRRGPGISNARRNTFGPGYPGGHAGGNGGRYPGGHGFHAGGNGARYPGGNGFHAGGNGGRYPGGNGFHAGGNGGRYPGGNGFHAGGNGASYPGGHGFRSEQPSQSRPFGGIDEIDRGQHHSFGNEEAGIGGGYSPIQPGVENAVPFDGRLPVDSGPAFEPESFGHGDTQVDGGFSPMQPDIESAVPFDYNGQQHNSFGLDGNSAGQNNNLGYVAGQVIRGLLSGQPGVGNVVPFGNNGQPGSGTVGQTPNFGYGDAQAGGDFSPKQPTADDSNSVDAYVPQGIDTVDQPEGIEQPEAKNAVRNTQQNEPVDTTGLQKK